MKFFKYQGTGNDFVLFDNRINEYDGLSTEQIRLLCDRHFGVGADGLMLLSHSNHYDFRMTYYNSDGNESTMCGNGGRCMVRFAYDLRILTQKECTFEAIDGVHKALLGDDSIVELAMNAVDKVEVYETFFRLNTGSPHYVTFSEDVHLMDIQREGRLIRYSPMFEAEGINVNFVEILSERELYVRTYERGVEDETLSCGTGVTAAAIVSRHAISGDHEILVNTKGGQLKVQFRNHDDGTVSNVWLIGPAAKVFVGEIAL